MLSNYLEKLIQKFPGASYTPLASRDEYLLTLHFQGRTSLICLKEDAKELHLRSNLAENPDYNRENVYCYLMEANVMGRKTGGAHFGYAEGMITFQKELPADLSYNAFFDEVELFWNWLENYWKAEFERFQKMAKERIL